MAKRVAERVYDECIAPKTWAHRSVNPVTRVETRTVVIPTIALAKIAEDDVLDFGELKGVCENLWGWESVKVTWEDETRQNVLVKLECSSSNTYIAA